jgi:RNA-directed DNA polymerase
VTNANRHLNADFVLNFDLEDFFPSIHFGRVKGLFESKPYNLPEAVAVTLAQVCCHNALLPAGAPTSPTISNMLCAKMDSQLKRLAIDCGCTYTRYADDVTLSVRHGRFPPPVCYRDPTTQRPIIGQEIVKIVTDNGFKINSSKTRLLPRGYRQEVTGLIVGAHANVKRDYIRHVRGMLHAAERWGVEGASAQFRIGLHRKQTLKTPDYLRVLRGKIDFVGSVRGRDDFIYFRMMRRYLALVPTARVRRIVAGPTASPEVIESAVWLLDRSAAA